MTNTKNEFYELSIEQSNKISILKFLFSVFLVYLHTSNILFDIDSPDFISSFMSFICSSVLFKCASGGFFIISSILLYRKEFIWGKNIKKKFKTLLVPYLFMNVLTIAIYIVAHISPFSKIVVFSSNKNILNFNTIEWLNAFGIFSSVPIYSTMWFLRNLFVLNIISIPLKRMIEKFPKISLLLLIINCIYNKITFFNLIYPETLLCWCIGCYVVKYNIRFPKIGFIKVLVFYLIVVAANCYIFICGIIIPNYLLALKNVFNVISGFIFWYSFIDLFSVRVKSALVFYSKYSFPIYLFHLYFVKFVFVLLLKNINSSLLLLLTFFIVPLVIVFVIIIFWNMCGRMNIKLISFISGGR